MDEIRMDEIGEEIKIVLFTYIVSVWISFCDGDAGERLMHEMTGDLPSACAFLATLSSEKPLDRLIDDLIVDLLGGYTEVTEMLSSIVDAVPSNERCPEELSNRSAQEAHVSINALVAKLPRCPGAGCDKRQVACWQDEGNGSCGQLSGYCNDPGCATRESDTKDCAHCGQRLSKILWEGCDVGIFDDRQCDMYDDY
jgi:hypothetical protein